ncbi:beta strand repeat-containing protein [Lactococcus fujiensis]|uniref:Uncharacterized protein n=2 Tax=Lactococcus fujiensis TaxID=610251 RepID=A0A2A5RM55_9LACT|nr:hypothetical protein [Lactococcus fujiensis]PCS00372.1 hypothetical protein RT41_GL001259 [Lactococcus fujiensis JCM 16395]
MSIDKSDSTDNIWAGVVRGGSYFGYQNGQTYLSIGTTGLVTSTWGAGLLNSASGTAGTAFGNLPANLNSLYSESNNTYANGSGFEVTASGASNTGVFEAAGGTTGLGNFVNYYQNGSSTLISGSTPAAGFGLVATQVYGGAFSGYQNGSSGATQANYASGTYINGGMIGQAFGGGRSAGITFGDSELKITGGQIDTVATGGDYDVAFHKGNANTEMDGGIINGSLVGTLISSGYWTSGGSGKNWNIAYVTNTGTAWSSSNSLYYSPMQLIGSTQVRITGGDYSGAPNGSDLSHKTICGGPVNGQETGSSNIAVDAENATSSSSASPMVGVSSSTLLKFSPGVPFTGGGAPAEQITNANGSLQDTEPWMGSGLTSSINLFIYGNPSQSVLNGAQLSGDSMSAYRADGSANFGGYQTDGNPNVDTDISGVNMTVDAPKDSFGNIYASDYPIAHNTHFLTYYNGISTSGLNYNVNINVLNAGQIMKISGGQGYAAPETSSNTLFDMPMRNGSVYPTGNASNATGVINPSFSSTTVESFTSSNVNWNSSTGSVSSGSNTALVTLGNSANKTGLNHIYLADRLENFTSLDVKNNGILTLNYNPDFTASSTYGTVTGWTANSSVVAATTNGTGITNPGQPISTATQSGATESPSGVVWTAAQPSWTERTSTDATTSQPVGTVYGVSGWTQGINNPSMTYYDPNYESMVGLDTQGTVLNGASAQQMTGTFSNSATGASGSSGTYATGESAYQFASCEFDSKSGIFTGAFWGNSWANQSTTTTFSPLTTQVYLGNVTLDGDSEFSTPYLTTDRIINMHSISMVTTGSKMTWRGNNIAVGTSTSPVNINTSPVSGLSKTENGTYWGTSSSSMPFITFDQKAGTSDGIANINEVNFLGDDPNSMYGYGLLGDTDKTDTAYTATDEIFLGAGQIREFDTNNAKAGGGSWAFNSGFSSDFTTDATTPMGTGDNVGKKVLVTAYDSNGNVLTGSQWNTGATKIVLMYPSSTYAPTSSGSFYSFPSATTGEPCLRAVQQKHNKRAMTPSCLKHQVGVMFKMFQ